MSLDQDRHVFFRADDGGLEEDPDGVALDSDDDGTDDNTDDDDDDTHGPDGEISIPFYHAVQASWFSGMQCFCQECQGCPCYQLDM